MIDYTGRTVTGEQLRRARARLGLTQAALAEVLGTTSNTVARWERGELPMNEVAARFVQHLMQDHSPPLNRLKKRGRLR